ncbi:MAG: RDD family protein [Deltaproteobacteria bacterium]|nr:MAG: RDD family protein [Deltaproteobacteria bacterium]
MTDHAAKMPITAPTEGDERAAAPGFVAAPTWRRWLALLVDALPLLTVWLLCAFAIGDASASGLPSTPWNPLDQLVDFINARPTTAALIVVMLAALGFAWPLVAHLVWGRTPGKRVLGLAVVDARGQRPSTRRLAGWCALRVLGMALLFGGVLWAIADPERRTLYDRLAGIYVIRPAAD